MNVIRTDIMIVVIMNNNIIDEKLIKRIIWDDMNKLELDDLLGMYNIAQKLMQKGEITDVQLELYCMLDAIIRRKLQ